MADIQAPHIEPTRNNCCKHLRTVAQLASSSSSRSSRQWQEAGISSSSSSSSKRSARLAVDNLEAIPVVPAARRRRRERAVLAVVRVLHPLDRVVVDRFQVRDRVEQRDGRLGDGDGERAREVAAPAADVGRVVTGARALAVGAARMTRGSVRYVRRWACGCSPSCAVCAKVCGWRARCTHFARWQRGHPQVLGGAECHAYFVFLLDCVRAITGTMSCQLLICTGLLQICTGNVMQRSRTQQCP
jgi:hypothetical protein